MSERSREIAPPRRRVKCTAAKISPTQLAGDASTLARTANTRYYNDGYNDAQCSTMVKLKVTTVGSSAGVVLPKEVLARLKVEKGDMLYLTEAPEGYRITPYNPDFERQMELAKQVMRERREVLKALAK